MKQILIYLGDNQYKKEPLDTILNDINIAHRFLTDEDLNETLGYLLNLPGFTQNTNPKPLHCHIDFMYLDEISDEMIMMLNELMSAKGITMKRKGMRTATNEKWKLIDLLSEIEAEHAYFQKLEYLYKLLQDSAELVIDSYTKESWQAYEKAFYQGYQLLQQKQAQLPDIETAITNLLFAKEQLTLIG